jgi:endoglucanase
MSKKPKLNVALLKRICETAGAPGFEKDIRNLVLEELGTMDISIRVDNLGNIIANRGSMPDDGRKKILVAAHMDEIGFVVTHIEESGFLRFHTLGGFDPKTLTAQRVKVHGKKTLMGVMGTKPVHVMKPEERKKMPESTDYFIDMGMPGEEVSKWVSVGDPVTWERELVEIGNCINCKSIDNRISVFILLEALRRLKETALDVYAAFTVQEEVGLRGANVLAHQINPDFALALDTTIAFDVPGAQPHEKITSLGKGAAIKIMDASVICDYRMVEFLKKTADENKIAWQPEILTAGGTDTAGLQRMGKDGAISGAISVPTRHLHQVIEMADQDDVDACINLLCATIEGVEHHDWDHV